MGQSLSSTKAASEAIQAGVGKHGIGHDIDDAVLEATKRLLN